MTHTPTIHNVMRFRFRTAAQAACFIADLDRLGVAHKGAARKSGRYIVTTDTRVMAHAKELTDHIQGIFNA